MKLALIFLGVAALGNVTYHLAQKTISATANPMVLLMAVYAVAFLLAAAAAPFFRDTSGGSWTVQVFQWPVLALGAGVLLIEVGFLLAYRSGNILQWAGVAVNGASALVLVPIALAVFRETLSPARFLGILLTLGGMTLLARR